MSFWEDLWGQAETAVNQGLDQVKQVGVPAIQAAIEQWGIDTLNKQHQETTAKLNEGIKNVSAQPSSALGNAFNTVVTDTATTLYGHWIIFGLAAAAVGGYFLLRK